MSSTKRIVKRFNDKLKHLNKYGWVKDGKCLFLAANYAFKILTEDDELHTEENLDKLFHCKIIYSHEGQKMILMRELIKLNKRPTEGKFVNINKLSDI